jgi:glutamyl-tRNA reductase
MNLLMAGIDYTMAPVDVRACFSYTRTRAQEALLNWKKEPGVEECVLLSTCNRTELYVVGAADPAALLGRADVNVKLAHRQGLKAVLHLHQVAAGLCSQVLGEEQILGQVKEAAAWAEDCQSCGPVLSRLFRSAVTAGKRIRSQMSFSPVGSSVASQAVDKATEIMGGLAGKKALVIGSGEMGQLTAQLLLDRGCLVIMTLRRSWGNGRVPLPGVDLISYRQRYLGMLGCDLVFSTTASPHYTVEANQLLPGCPKLLVDLAVPRDIDPAVKTLAGIRLVDIDELGGAQIDQVQVALAQELLMEYVDDFHAWLRFRELLPLVQEVKAFAGAELVRALPSHDPDRVCRAGEWLVGKLLFPLKDSLTLDQLEGCYRALAEVAQRKRGAK